MIQAEFRRVLPSCLGFIPNKAIEYLDKAVRESPTSDITVLDAIAYAKIGHGDIYLVLCDKSLCGAVFFMYGHGNKGNILDIALLGGDNFMQWHDQIYDFTINIAKSKNCKEIWIVSREGWGRIFPKMKPIGTVFCLSLD